VPLLTFSSAPAQASQNQSTLTVSFVLKRGRLAVDRDRSSFVFSDTFKTRITESPGRVDAELAKAKRLILDDLDKLFLQTSQMYWYALPDDEKALDADGKLDDDLTKQIRAF